MSNPIGLPGAGQLPILSDCNDRYVIEARAIGSATWYSFSVTPVTADQANTTVNRLNAGDTSTVYRAHLVADSSLQRPSLISEVLPAFQHRGQHHVSRRVALLTQLVAFIRETGDGEFAHLCGDALKHLPESHTYQQHLLYIQSCSFEEGGDGLEVNVIRHRGMLELLSYVGMHLTVEDIQ